MYLQVSRSKIQFVLYDYYYTYVVVVGLSPGSPRAIGLLIVHKQYNKLMVVFES